MFLSLVILILGFFVFVFPSFAQYPPQVFQDLLSKVTATSWPNDIPLSPKATPVIPSVSSDHNPAMMDLEIGSIRTFWLTNQDSPETTISWYKQNLPQNGWTVFSKQEFMQIYDSFEIKEFEGINNLFSSLPGGQETDIEYIYGKQYLSSWKPEIHTKTRTNACRFFSVMSFDIDMAEDSSRPLMLMEITTTEACPNVCELPPEIEQERQEIENRIKSAYGFRITDSNLCDNEETCGDNSPLSIAEVLEIERVLGELPDCFTKNLRLVEIGGRGGGSIPALSEVYEATCCKVKEGKLSEQSGFGAYVYFDSKVTLCDKNYLGSRYTLAYILVHELTHSLQYQIVPPVCEIWPCAGAAYTNPLVIEWLKRTGWSPDGICIPFLGCPGVTLKLPPDLPTEYAKRAKNPLEDMAESVALYVIDPRKLLEISPRRYNFVRDKIMCGTEYHE